MSESTYTVSLEQLELLRNSLESADAYFDSLIRHLPKLIKSYEVQYIREHLDEPRYLRRLHLLGTLTESNREQLRELLMLLQCIRRR